MAYRYYYSPAAFLCGLTGSIFHLSDFGFQYFNFTFCNL